jgi:hypothetical protein
MIIKTLESLLMFISFFYSETLLINCLNINKLLLYLL